MRCCVVPVVALSLWAGDALAQAPAPSPPAAAVQPQAPPPALPSGPMRFQWVREGPADKCGDKCREWISATGDITGDTPRDFLFFSEARDPRGATVVLNSLGGSVIPALMLGRAFRSKAMTATVGRTDKLPEAADEARAVLSPYGTCASMCVFAMLGGARRYAPDEARVYVHQIWPRSKRGDPHAESFTADEVALMQREAGVLARYTVDMGAEVELYEIAMRIPPWERLRLLSKADMRRLRLVNADDAFGNAAAADTGMAPPLAPERLGPAAITDAGWTVGETAGKLGLKRRSPITIEGLPVGSFEVTFGCGDGAGTYAVAYSENRRLPLGDRLRRIVMAVGAERSALQIESSNTDRDGQLRTVAHGQVRQTLVDALAKTEGRSLVIGTQTLRNVQAVIQIGTAGFSQSYAKLADTCPK